MRERHQGPDQAAQADGGIAPVYRFPLVTFALIGILIAVFVGEQYYGGAPTGRLFAPSVATLIALGGLDHGRILQGGEWYRLFSSAFLHADVVHLLLNSIALFVIGAFLERTIARWLLLALFIVGALGGSLLSLSLNSPSVISVGASGAIMGLGAAALVCSSAYPSGRERSRMRAAILQMLVPAVLPIAFSRTGQGVDFAAHLGGALSGAFAGFLLLAASRPAFWVQSFGPPEPPVSTPRRSADTSSASLLARFPWLVLIGTLAVEAVLSSVDVSRFHFLRSLAQAIGTVVPVVKSHLATVTSTGVLGVFLGLTMILLPIKVWGAYLLMRGAGARDMDLTMGSSSKARGLLNALFLLILCIGGTLYVLVAFGDQSYFQADAPSSAVLRYAFLTTGGLATWFSWSVATQGVIAFAWAFAILVLVRSGRRPEALDGS